MSGSAGDGFPPPDLGRRSGSVSKRIASNTGLLLGAKIIATLLGIATLKIATDSLTAAEFGTIVFIHAYMLFFNEVASFHSWQTIIRFGTDDITENRPDRLARLFKFAYTLDGISAIAGFVLAIATFGLVARLAEFIPGLTPENGVSIDRLRDIINIYCILILFRFTSASIGIFRLFDRFTVLAVEALVMPVVRLSGAIIAASMGAGLTGFVAAWFVGSLVQYVFTWLAGFIELSRRGMFRRTFAARLRFFRPERPLWPFVIKSNVDATIATGFSHLPQLLVMAVFGPVWNGVYKIAEEVAKLLTEGFKLLDQVIYPELAKLVSERRTDRIWKIVTRAALVLLAVGFAFCIALALFGRVVLSSIFGPSYGEAVPLALLLVPAAALLGAAAPLYPIFYATDRPGGAILVRGSSLLIYLVTFGAAAVLIGRLAPGVAMIAANAFAVVTLMIVTPRVLKAAHQRHMSGTP